MPICLAARDVVVVVSVRFFADHSTFTADSVAAAAAATASGIVADKKTSGTFVLLSASARRTGRFGAGAMDSLAARE